VGTPPYYSINTYSIIPRLISLTIFHPGVHPQVSELKMDSPAGIQISEPSTRARLLQNIIRHCNSQNPFRNDLEGLLNSIQGFETRIEARRVQQEETIDQLERKLWDAERRAKVKKDDEETVKT
jgi:hypothetical protein